jgi:hypothetical protein
VSNQFPDDMQVEVRFPQFEGQDREAWPWLPGTVLQQVGPDEWQVCVVDDSVATPEAGELSYPACFREASEIRQPVPEPEAGLCRSSP